MNVQNIWQNMLLPKENYREDFMSLTSTHLLVYCDLDIADMN